MSNCGAVVRAIVERSETLAAAQVQYGDDQGVSRSLQDKRLPLVFLLDNMLQVRGGSGVSRLRCPALGCRAPGRNAVFALADGWFAPAVTSAGVPSARESRSVCEPCLPRVQRSLMQRAANETARLDGSSPPAPSSIEVVAKELPSKVAPCCRSVIPGCLPTGREAEGKADKVRARPCGFQTHQLTPSRCEEGGAKKRDGVCLLAAAQAAGGRVGAQELVHRRRDAHDPRGARALALLLACAFPSALRPLSRCGRFFREEQENTSSSRLRRRSSTRSSLARWAAAHLRPAAAAHSRRTPRSSRRRRRSSRWAPRSTAPCRRGCSRRRPGSRPPLRPLASST